jgi:prevent-host-death family protein
MVRTLSVKEARNTFATLLGQVHFGKDTVIVQKQGKPVVAVIDFDRYRALVEEREKRFRVLDRVWGKNKDKDPRRAAEDARQAVVELRAARQSRR